MRIQLEAIGAAGLPNGLQHLKRPGDAAGNTEHKYRDPNGVVFDIVNDYYARNSWGANPD